MPRERLSPKAFRRSLRRDSTDAEARLWSIVRGRRLGAKFRRQHSLDRFTVDLVCLEARLAIELDGGQHFEARERLRDRERDAILGARGLEVLRFTDREVLLEPAAVAEVILNAVERRAGRALQGQAPPHPSPLPQVEPGGEGAPGTRREGRSRHRREGRSPAPA